MCIVVVSQCCFPSSPRSHVPNTCPLPTSPSGAPSVNPARLDRFCVGNSAYVLSNTQALPYYTPPHTSCHWCQISLSVYLIAHCCALPMPRARPIQCADMRLPMISGYNNIVLTPFKIRSRAGLTSDQMCTCPYFHPLSTKLVDLHRLHSYHACPHLSSVADVSTGHHPVGSARATLPPCVCCGKATSTAVFFYQLLVPLLIVCAFLAHGWLAADSSGSWGVGLCRDENGGVGVMVSMHHVSSMLVFCVAVCVGPAAK